ncbi:ftsH3, partial [Symbiodinium necroappetens]
EVVRKVDVLVLDWKAPPKQGPKDTSVLLGQRESEKSVVWGSREQLLTKFPASVWDVCICSSTARLVLDLAGQLKVKRRLALQHDYNLPLGPWGQEQTPDQLKEHRSLLKGFELLCASQHLVDFVEKWGEGDFRARNEAPRQMQAQARSTAASSAASMTQEAGQLHMAAAGGSAAVMGAVAALGPRRAAAKRSRQIVATRAAKQEALDGLSELVGLAEQLVHRPGPQQLFLLVQQLQAFASAELRRGAELSAPAARAFEEVVQGASEALVSSADKQLKWAAGAAASLLLTFSVTLQPAFAADVVNYSDFMESVNRGDVEMVRVQDDQLSAQYTTKDGARKEVNLIPNAQIEDQLFNILAQKKVDVVMQTPGANSGGPLDFLARFASPIAWLIAGLLFLFGGAGMGGPAGPGGPGGNPFELGKSKARIIKDGDTKVKFADVAGCD